MPEHLKIFGSKSRCHNSLSIIVRSREGGFVTQNCSACGRPRALRPSDLPSLVCRTCGTELEPFSNWYGNYAYRCGKCNWETQLGDMVPHWDELFDYHGYAIDPPAQASGQIDPEQLRAALEAIQKLRH